MTNPGPTLLVAVADHSAVIKVNGRANFSTSVTFKRLISELQQRGFDHFVLDLGECVTMDSTFLGVLAGTAVRLSESSETGQVNGKDRNRPVTPALRLLNANQRVADLLDNLGISELFPMARCETPAVANDALTPAQESHPSRQELSETCLEAHRILMELNPANVSKFKDVTQFLAEDLKKLNAEGSKP